MKGFFNLIHDVTGCNWTCDANTYLINALKETDSSLQPSVTSVLFTANIVHGSKFMMTYYKRILLLLLHYVINLLEYFQLRSQCTFLLHDLQQTHQVIALTTLLHNSILPSCYYSFCTVVLTYNSSFVTGNICD